MLAKVGAAAVNGIEAYPVEVEVNSGWGDTSIVIVGLPDAAVKESRDRVTTALSNSGFKFPLGRTTINLAPADVKKEGPSFDLPIAVGMVESVPSSEAPRVGWSIGSRTIPSRLTSNFHASTTTIGRHTTAPSRIQRTIDVE